MCHLIRQMSHFCKLLNIEGQSVLSKLNFKVIDLYFIHWPSQSLNIHCLYNLNLVKRIICFMFLPCEKESGVHPWPDLYIGVADTMCNINAHGTFQWKYYIYRACAKRSLHNSVYLNPTTEGTSEICYRIAYHSEL